MKALSSTKFRKNWHWLALPALFCLTRLLMLFYSPHSTARFEELYQGYLGIEFLDGLQSNLWDYQIDPYTGGSLFVGALAAVSFKIFGNSLFALKLVPFLFSFVTLFVVMGFLQRFFGKRAAISGGLLTLFPAPALASLSLLALGSHPESRLFVAGIIWVFYEVLFHKKTRSVLWLLLGFLTAFSLWFSIINTVVILSILLTWVFSPKKPELSWRSLLASAAGIVLGLLPWIVYNFSSGFETITYLRDLLFSRSFESLPKFFIEWSLEIVRLVIVEIPASLSPFLNLPGFNPVFVALYSFIVLSLMLTLYQRFLPNSLSDSTEERFEPEMRGRLLFFVIFPVIFLVTIAFFTLRMAWHGEMLPYRFRYFATFYLYLCLLGAILGTYGHRLLRILMLAMIGMGVIGFGALLRPQNAGKLLRVPGYSIEPVRHLWDSHTLPRATWDTKDWGDMVRDENLFLKAIHDPAYWRDWDRDPNPQQALELSPRLKYYYFLNMGMTLAAESIPEEFNIPSWLGEREKQIFYFGYAKGLRWELLVDQPDKIVSYYDHLPETARPWFLFILARHIYIWDPQLYQYEITSPRLEDFVQGLPQELKRWIYRGIGSGFLNFFPNLYALEKKADKILSILPQEFHKDFWWGLGWNLRGRRGRYDTQWLETQMTRLIEPYKQPMREGFEGYQLQWYADAKQETSA